ncbi:hypothetical protein NUSPORA_01815 [Nucleospora cyclopteri]
MIPTNRNFWIIYILIMSFFGKIFFTLMFLIDRKTNNIKIFALLKPFVFQITCSNITILVFLVSTLLRNEIVLYIAQCRTHFFAFIYNMIHNISILIIFIKSKKRLDLTFILITIIIWICELIFLRLAKTIIMIDSVRKYYSKFKEESLLNAYIARSKLDSTKHIFLLLLVVYTSKIFAFKVIRMDSLISKFEFSYDKELHELIELIILNETNLNNFLTILLLLINIIIISTCIVYESVTQRWIALSLMVISILHQVQVMYLSFNHFFPITNKALLFAVTCAYIYGIIAIYNDYKYIGSGLKGFIIMPNLTYKKRKI